MSKATFCGTVIAALILGLGVRLMQLDGRPMHHDEANQAVKFGKLLETGEYRYDPDDHHGPTLYYLTLPFAWARGQKDLASLDEWTLRAVPALFGAGLILLLIPLAGKLERGAVAAGTALLALSPALTYYSRFYIQESILAFFALCFLIAAGRYAIRPTAGRALAAGAFAGLAYATKETMLVVLAAAGAALVLARFWTFGRPQRRPDSSRSRLKGIARVAAGVAAALAVAVVLYSSFFQNPGGIADSFRSLRGYTVRGVADPGFHAHPWYFYLVTLAYSRSGGVLWTEGLVLLLAVAGMTEAFFGTPRLPGYAGAAAADSTEGLFWRRYLAIYSLFAAAVFSLLSYKTPWNLVPFYLGFVILAGSGAAALVKRGQSGTARAFLIAALFAGICHLGWENRNANFLYPADPRNPYVYAQTSPDLVRLVQRVHDLSLVHPDGDNMLVKVVAGSFEQWPLPWYLRRLHRVGYWTDPSAAGPLAGTPVVIASQEYLDSIQAALEDRAAAEIYGLRPDVLLALYIDRPLWERFLKIRN